MGGNIELSNVSKGVELIVLIYVKYILNLNVVIIKGDLVLRVIDELLVIVLFCI